MSKVRTEFALTRRGKRKKVFKKKKKTYLVLLPVTKRRVRRENVDKSESSYTVRTDTVPEIVVLFLLQFHAEMGAALGIVDSVV